MFGDKEKIISQRYIIQQKKKNISKICTEFLKATYTQDIKSMKR